MTSVTIETPRVFLPLLKPARYKGAHGGRGSGKSHFFAELMIEENIASKLDNVCLREIQKSLEFSVKKLLESKISKLNAGAYFEVQDKRILTRRGGVIIFEGLQNHTADSIKSLEGFDRAWVEESQSLSQRSLDILRPTIRKPASEIWFSWNPNKDTDPVDALLRCDNPPGDAIVVQANYRDNPFLPDELKAEVEYDMKRDPEKFAHVWLGEYQRNSEARVFRNWKVQEFETKEGATFRLGADWGFATDPSVLVRCYLEGRNLYVDYEAYMVGCEIDMLPDLFDRVPDARKWFITADSARPETISYMQRHGFPRINSAIKGAKSVEEGVEFLKSFDIIVHPRCQHTIDELTMYSYKTDPLTGQVLPVLADRHNHCLVAGTMISTARGNVPIESVLIGDLVMTRSGFKKVTFSDVTDINRKVVKVNTNNGSLVCTPDHKIFTLNKGFIRADSLSYNDEVLIYFRSSLWLKLLSTNARFTDVILKAKEGLIGFISNVPSLVELFGFIGKFGLMNEAQSQMGFISTTKTETRLITTSATLSAYRQSSISVKNTNGMRLEKLGSLSFLIKSGRLQKFGMLAKKVLKSIEKLAQKPIKTLSLLLKNASNAIQSSCLTNLGMLTYSALTNANQHGVENQELTMLRKFASNVKKYLFATSIASKKFAQGRVLTVIEAGIAEKVYDLTVIDEHEFFADGILVHNCIDALRYSCEGVRKAPQHRERKEHRIPQESGWLG